MYLFWIENEGEANRNRIKADHQVIQAFIIHTRAPKLCIEYFESFVLYTNCLIMTQLIFWNNFYQLPIHG
jgi:hypothetical protein